MAQSPLQARSLGLKILAVGLIVLLLSIPLMFVNFLSWERAGRAETARQEIGESYGGSQLVRGPFLVLPVAIDTPAGREGQTRRSWEHIIISPDQLAIEAGQSSQIRRRAIFEVPVYDAVMSFSGRFALPDVSALIPEYGSIHWESARVLFAVSDVRAIGEDLVFSVENGGSALSFEPGTDFDRIQAGAVGQAGIVSEAGRWQGISADINGIRDRSAFNFNARLRLTGADTFMLAASGRNTRVSLRSDWPHPSFIGAYLPEDHTITADGYEANWQIPYLARGVSGASLQSDFDIRRIDRTAFGVRLFTPTDGYTSVGRSLKYAIFFIGFLMLMFFLIEAASKDRVHAAQYILIGLAQVVFYLLLLAFSEHMATFIAYFTASAATVSVTSLYAVTAFRSKARGMATFAVLGVIYAMQYALVLLEDYALLIGAILAFFAVALTMYVTRKLNWYELVPEKSAS
jgi:inner membrane protein